MGNLFDVVFCLQARDFQEAVAGAAVTAGVEGPGVPLVGAYNVTQGSL